MTTHTPAMLPIVEELAQKVLGYMELAEENSVVLRRNPSRYQAADDRVAHSSFAAQPGQAWVPPCEEKQAYIDYLDSICGTIPVCDDDRVKIVFAAYAALAYFAKYVIPEESQKNQDQISKRVSDLHDEFVKQLVSQGAVPDRRETTPRPPEPYAGLPHSLNRRQLTADEKKSISANPTNIIGKHFIHILNANEEQPFKVVGASFMEDGIVYHVRFIDCVDSMEISGDEMEKMFRNSVFVT